jgi:hypothetical protein
MAKGEHEESLKNLAENRTLIVQQFTQKPPSRPEIVENLQNIEDVFDYYKPTVEVDFTDGEGVTLKEEIKFRSIYDFQLNSLISNSAFLNELKLRTDTFGTILNELQKNSRLKKILSEKKSKEALINILKAMIDEIERYDKK